LRQWTDVFFSEVFWASGYLMMIASSCCTPVAFPALSRASQELGRCSRYQQAAEQLLGALLQFRQLEVNIAFAGVQVLHWLSVALPSNLFPILAA
jgi:hypothetical protein